MAITEGGSRGSNVMVRVGDVDAHHERARERGAQILGPPTDYPYGERQYTAVDLGGHTWTFSQSIADVAPEDWGATSRRCSARLAVAYGDSGSRSNGTNVTRPLPPTL